MRGTVARSRLTISVVIPPPNDGITTERDLGCGCAHAPAVAEPELRS